MAAERVIDGAAFAAAARRLEAEAPAAIDRAAERSVDELAELTLAAVRVRRARHRVTGKGERLVGIRATGSGSHRVARVHAAGRVAHLITGGTRAHAIRPHRADALRIRGAARGFAAAVHHPGTRADPFVAEGIADARGDAHRVVDDAARAIVRDLGDELTEG